MPAEGTTHDRNDLPDGAIVTVEVEIVGYLDPTSGDTLYGTRWSGDTTLSSALGLVEMAKHDLLVRRDHDDEYD